MAKKEKEEIRTDGWKDTFSDLMNLLLCFFVLLYSMSNVDHRASMLNSVASAQTVSYLTGGEKQLVTDNLFQVVQVS
ncbi:MAG: flagellar motor protein MotB [Butyribacter sp.]